MLLAEAVLHPYMGAWLLPTYKSHWGHAARTSLAGFMLLCSALLCSLIAVCLPSLLSWVCSLQVWISPLGHSQT